nr:MAG TPA: hypothetical protein [Caudoviricetes sp.]
MDIEQIKGLSPPDKWHDFEEWQILPFFFYVV